MYVEKYEKYVKFENLEYTRVQNTCRMNVIIQVCIVYDRR